MSVLLAMSLPYHKLYAAIEYAVGTGLFSCKESRHEGSTSCQRSSGKFAIILTKLGCENVASLLQEAIREETTVVRSLDEVLQYVDSGRFTNMR